MSKALKPAERFSLVVNSDDIRSRFERCLQENAGAFIASLISLYADDTYLQNCDAKAVALEALKAATLKLPIEKSLGFAYIIPYKGKPTFRLGWRGIVQLAQRSGQYAVINTAKIYEGLDVNKDWITGEITITGSPKSKKAQGYLAHFRLLNGFAKTLYMSREEVHDHADKYAPSYHLANSAWKTNFDEMAQKTCLRLLVGKYGPMSVEMQQAFKADEEQDRTFEEHVEEEAYKEAIDAEFDVTDEEEVPLPEEPQPKPAVKKQAKKRGPNY